MRLVPDDGAVAISKACARKACVFLGRIVGALCVLAPATDLCFPSPELGRCTPGSPEGLPLPDLG